MSEDLVEGPWAIYTGSGMTLLIRQDDPEFQALTKILVRKRHWESITRRVAEAVFDRYVALQRNSQRRA